MNFSTPVTRSEGLAGLINAVNNGTLGPFTVRDFKFLERFDPPTTPTTLPKETTTKSKGIFLTSTKQRICYCIFRNVNWLCI